jgi:hypothetical protein
VRSPLGCPESQVSALHQCACSTGGNAASIVVAVLGSGNATYQLRRNEFAIANKVKFNLSLVATSILDNRFELVLERKCRQPRLGLVNQADRQEPHRQRQLGAVEQALRGQRSFAPTDGVVNQYGIALTNHVSASP